MTKRALEEAVERSLLQVTPAVRGCIYLVPRAQVPLVMRVAEDSAGKRMERSATRSTSRCSPRRRRTRSTRPPPS
jgi:hypothetical protein